MRGWGIGAARACWAQRGGISRASFRWAAPLAPRQHSTAHFAHPTAIDSHQRRLQGAAPNPPLPGTLTKRRRFSDALFCMPRASFQKKNPQNPHFETNTIGSPNAGSNKRRHWGIACWQLRLGLGRLARLVLFQQQQRCRRRHVDKARCDGRRHWIQCRVLAWRAGARSSSR